MTVEVQLLGRFQVRRDGVPVPPFPRRSAANLVKLLALSRGHRLTCERAVDALWPDVLLDEGRPRLHKAAHYARRTLGLPDGVVLQDNWVALLPGQAVDVDVERFEAAAAAALAVPVESREAACAAAAGRCAGLLLPEDEQEAWTLEPRERVRSTRLAVLRAAHRWDAVLDLDPADEDAHLELLREAVAAGDPTEALRRYDRMARALRDRLDVAPSAAADALRERALSLAQEGHRTDTNALPASTGPARAGPRPVLLERDEELAALVDRVEQAVTAGRGAVVLLTGEAGSGKTALLGELIARVGDRLRVLRVGCDDLLAPRSLGPFRDLAQVVTGELADALSAGGDPEAVFPALFRLLGDGPVLVAIEDVHWADDATLDAIRFLARRIEGLPAVLLLTCRADELGRTHPLHKVLGSLPRSTLHRIPTRPLTKQAVATLAGPRTDPERLHRVTRGNPFFVTEVLAAGGSGVPPTVRDAVLARLAAGAQDLVQRLAVVPSRVGRDLAEHLADGQLEPLLEAERAGVMTGDATHVWFRHEIARAAVVTTLTPGELVAAHRRVLDALLRDPAPDLARLVHHAQAGRRTDVLVEYGPAAAQDAVRAGAYRSAAETLRVVIDAGTALSPDRLARLLADRASCLYYLNLFEQAHAVGTDAVTRAERAADPGTLADAYVVLSKTAFWARGPLAARDAAARAVGLLEHSDDARRRAGALAMLARSHSNLGTLGIVAEPGAECTAYAAQALALAERAEDNEIRSQALFYVGSGRLADGDERGMADLERSVQLSDGDPHLELRVRACVNAAGSAHRFGRFADAERYVDLGLRAAEQSEFFGGDYRLRLTRASMRACQGRWDEAIAELRDLLATPDDPAAMGLMARALLARLLGRRGDPEAGRVLAAAVPLPDSRGEVFVEGPLVTAAVDLAWLRGETAAMPGLAADVLRSAAAVGHRGSRSELSRYLQRGGHDVDPPADALGPWAPALAGRPLESADAWAALGERYEEAVERVLSGVPAERDRGLRALAEFGAVATLATLRRRQPVPA